SQTWASARSATPPRRAERSRFRRATRSWPGRATRAGRFRPGSRPRIVDEFGTRRIADGAIREARGTIVSAATADEPEARLAARHAPSHPRTGASVLAALGVPVVLAALFAGCAPSDREVQYQAQRAILQRQNQGIRELIQEAERGTLLPKDRFMIGIDEHIVADLLRSELP